MLLSSITLFNLRFSVKSEIVNHPFIRGLFSSAYNTADQSSSLDMNGFVPPPADFSHRAPLDLSSHPWLLLRARKHRPAACFFLSERRTLRRADKAGEIASTGVVGNTRSIGSHGR